MSGTFLLKTSNLWSKASFHSIVLILRESDLEDEENTSSSLV